MILLSFVLAFSSLLAFAPHVAEAHILKVGKKSNLWVRMIGVLGIAYVLLVLATDQSIMLVQFQRSIASRLLIARHTVAGMIFGLFLALYTQRRESGESRGTTKKGRNGHI